MPSDANLSLPRNKMPVMLGPVAARVIVSMSSRTHATILAPLLARLAIPLTAAWIVALGYELAQLIWPIG